MIAFMRPPRVGGWAETLATGFGAAGQWAVAREQRRALRTNVAQTVGNWTQPSPPPLATQNLVAGGGNPVGMDTQTLLLVGGGLVAAYLLLK